MKHQFAYGAIVLVLVVGGWYVFDKGVGRKGDMTGEQQKADMMAAGDAGAMTKDGGTSTEIEGADAMSKDVVTAHGSYEAYAPEKLASAMNGPVVLFFRASWCPTCRALDADIRAHAKNIPTHTTILDVDYDTATDLKKKYMVTYQHTFVQVDAQGDAIATWSGSPTLAALLSSVR